MTGVEILHSSEVPASGGFNGEIFISTLIVCVIMGFIIGTVMSIIDLEIEWMLGGIGISVMLGLLLGAVIGDISSSEVYETHYKVFVSDEVSMNEFLEKYEIIDQEGKIYTVKEKADKE